MIRQNPRADVYLGPRWRQHPHCVEIDGALARAEHEHRLGKITDLSSSFGTLGVSGA